MSSDEGFLTITGGHRLWYRRVPGTAAPPLLVLHGGPGASWDYLEPVLDLSPDRTVVVYDQLESGRSDHPGDPALWTIERYADEVDDVRSALGLDTVDLFGHSWGGWLVIEYMTRLHQPTGVRRVVLGSTSSSLRQVAEETGRLRRELPAEVRRVLDEHEAAGTIDSPEFQEAAMVFYRRHVCRLDPWPDFVMRTFDFLGQGGAYLHMQGPNEFTITGNLRDWDRTADLGKISAPTLVVCGEFDELGEPCADVLVAGIPGAEKVVVSGCSHTWLAEDPNRGRDVLHRFLGS